VELRAFARHLTLKWAAKLPELPPSGDEDAPETLRTPPPTFDEPETPKPVIEPLDELAKKLPKAKDDDTSLGFLIDKKLTKRWKNRLINGYDQIKEEMLKEPAFKGLYRDIGAPEEEALLVRFNNLLNAYVPNVANSNLKDAFAYAVKYIDAFNELRDELPHTVKDKKRMYRIDHAIWSLQNYMWRKAKNILNIHNIGSGDVEMSPEEKAELEKVLGRAARGTWDFGPLKNPTKPLSRESQYEVWKRDNPDAPELQEWYPGKKESPTQMMRRLTRRK